ncbi:MAG: radical SAM protein [Desulfobulbaceae bacterium]|nr:radical SAM protein [Desulfobulbaceae bacterium]
MSKDHQHKILAHTGSVCPVCLKALAAVRRQEGDAVFLIKNCPEHGEFRTCIWRGKITMPSWQRPKKPSAPRSPVAVTEKGCPFDCGLCSAHGQHTCTALLEITARCNLRCKVCFADAGSGSGQDPSLARISVLYDEILRASGPCNIQLSGGEPTMRDDLAEIIRLGRRKGFSFLQLNTNGIRLGLDASYARSLQEAGLASVFLQFDGISDDVHQAIRGKALAALKEQAIIHCGAAGLGVVLVPTIIPGINTGQIGEIVRYGARFSPVVRGVHFQPVSYFGRYPAPPLDQDRITLPEIMEQLARQCEGEIRTEHFAPPACEHALCSFHANYLLQPDGSLQALGAGRQACCSTSNACDPLPTAMEGRDKSVSFTARQWAAPDVCDAPVDPAASVDDLDIFLRRAQTHRFSISGMAFQDAWNLDLERLQGCCIHVISPEGKLIPFCAYNLTSTEGRSLYRMAEAP